MNLLKLTAAVLLAAAAALVSSFQGPPPIPVRSLLGAWQTEDGQNVWIAQVDEKTLSLVGARQVEWRGPYVDGKLELSVKPTAAQMNPDIPDWARDLVAKQGTLEWKLKLSPAEDKDGMTLIGEMLPGEVDWQEVSDPNTNEIYKRTARVTGASGTPIKMKLSKVPHWGIVDTYDLSQQVLKSTARGTEAYHTLFAYGPSMPGLISQVKKVLSDAPGIDYDLLGASGDSFRMSAANQALMEKGWKLATTGIRPADADWIRQNWGAVIIRAHVAGSVYPGRYTYKLDSAAGGWFLTKGTAKAQVRMFRDPLHAAPEVTDHAVIGERIHFQIDAPERWLSPWKNQIPLVLGLDGTWMNVGAPTSSFAATADSDVSRLTTVFRSPYIRLVHDGDPGLPPQRKVGFVNGELHIVVAETDMVQVGLANPRMFLAPTALQNVNVLADDEGLWVKALRRAAIADGLTKQADELRAERGRTVAEIQNVMLTQIGFKLRLQYASPYVRFLQYLCGVSDAEAARGSIVNGVKVKLGNQAAAILLRDEFVLEMDKVVSELDAVTGDANQVAFMDSLKSEILNGSNPIGNLLVTDDRPQPAIQVTHERYAIRDLYSSTTFTRDRVSQQTWLAMAFRSYRKAVEDARLKANSVGDGDIQGLLALTGDCFAPIVKAVVPKLVWFVQDDAKQWSWEPDNLARAEVKNIANLWEAVKAQKEWSAIDTQVAIAAITCSLQLVAPAGGALRILSATANVSAAVEGVAQSVPAYFYTDDAKAAFAIGTYRLLGSEPFDMVQAQRTPAWAVALNLIGLGLVGATDLPTLMCSMPAGHAMAVAPRVAAAVETNGMKALMAATPEEFAAFIDAAGAVESKAAVAGAKLEVNEAEIENALQVIRKDIEAQHGFQVKPPEGPAPAAEPPKLAPERVRVSQPGDPLPLADEAGFKNPAAEDSPTLVVAGHQGPEGSPPPPPADAHPPRPPPATPAADASGKTPPAYRLDRLHGEHIPKG
ncbi:MAG TPA: hypothetical protein VKT78_02675, partial [Fimbriimonadaceae bacterium]|nr:hypothetical protein [Fimbriimonadaceae bacterium]